MIFSAASFAELPFSTLPFINPSIDLTLVYDRDVLIDSVHLDGSLASTLLTTGSSVPQYWFGPKLPFSFSKNVEYSLSFDASCIKSISTFDAQMDVYLVGTAFPTYTNAYGYRVATLSSPDGNVFASLGNQSINFIPDVNGTAVLRFVVYSGQWHVQDVNLVFASERGYPPDGARGLVQITGRRHEKLQFGIELLDANSNVFPVLIESSPVVFDGGTTQIRGDNNRVDGTLIVSPSGSGPILATTKDGAFIGISTGSIPRPIYPDNLVFYTGSAFISIYSGSQPFQDQLITGSAIGLQIVGGSGSNQSYLDYSTATQTLRIRGDISVLPGTALSAAIASGPVSGGLALAQIQALVNGSGPSLPTGTFINGISVISPIIAGNTGYFSSQFGVGNISGGNGIVLTALGYTSSVTVSVPNAPAIYIGKGQHASPQTPFLVASSSTGPVFSLGNNVIFQPSGSIYELIIRGKVKVIDPATNVPSDSFNDIRNVIINTITFGPYGFYIANL